LKLLGYLTRRLFQMIPVLLGITIVAFLFIKLLPGDPLTIMTAGKATPEQVANLKHRLGLDKPWPVQYGLFIINAVQGDLGNSITKKAPVTQIIGERIPVTLFLVGYGALIGLIITLPLAIISALHPDRRIDHGIRVGGMLFFGMPSFWLGLLLMLLFGLKLKLFPISGWGEGFLGHLHSLFLPALVVGLGLAPMWIQSLRSSMLDIFQADFIEVARAKGLNPTRVLLKHVLRNALIPTITIIAVNLGWLMGGEVVIETVFSIPGLGQLLIQSVFTRDYPTIQGLTLWFGIIVMVVNLVADLSYALIDPRITIQ
jgi:ABC-type dipeptide/oligopeptide/nickel transport system permease component